MTRPDLAEPAYHRELLAAELQLCARGIWTIPLRLATDDRGENKWQPATKAPYTLGPGMPTHVTAEQIRARRAAHPAAGIGIACGSQPCGRHLIAIDVDVPGALDELAAQHGETITNTWRQRTRRDWHHLYYLTERQALVADLAIRNIKIADGAIDVRAHHSYVIGAPTYHRVLDGTRYIDHWREPEQLPEWLFRIIRDGSIRIVPDRSDERDLDDALIERDYPYAWRLYRAQRLCETHDPAVDGKRGSDTTFSLALSLTRGLALRREDAIELIERVYNRRCVDQHGAPSEWSRAEIEHKVDDAIANGQRAKGWLLAKSRDQAEDGSPRAARSPRYRAEIVGVDERIRGPIWYSVLDGARVGQLHHRLLDWPSTPRSAAIWDAHARAVGLDAITAPHAQLRGRVVQIEIADGTAGRIGNVYADDTSPSEVT